MVFHLLWLTIDEQTPAHVAKNDLFSELQIALANPCCIQNQWRNRQGAGGGGDGAECPPETSDQEISADLPGKKRQGGNGVKIEKKRRKTVKGKVEN